MGITVDNELSERSIARFWSLVDKTGECWLWLGSKKSRGYGRIMLEGVVYHAHRLSYQLQFGPIPSDLCVCHDCPDGDNTSCVNPAHLFLGSTGDNTRDASEKGRMAHGERHHSAKLTAEKVREIRRLRSEGASERVLAAVFDVSSTAIHRLLHRVTWSEVA